MSRIRSKDTRPEKIVRKYLFENLRILAVHSPAAFVMENVKGLLSAQTEHSPVFSKILTDLSDPAVAYLWES